MQLLKRKKERKQYSIIGRLQLRKANVARRPQKLKQMSYENVTVRKIYTANFGESHIDDSPAFFRTIKSMEDSYDAGAKDTENKYNQILTKILIEADDGYGQVLYNKFGAESKFENIIKIIKQINNEPEASNEA